MLYFWRFWSFFELPILAQASSIGNWFFFEKWFKCMYVISRIVKDFHDIKFWVNNQYSADAISVKSTLWHGPSAIFSCTHQKDLKLSQSLDIDKKKTLSKFGEIMSPFSDFMGRSAFYGPAPGINLQIVLWNSEHLRYRSEIVRVNIWCPYWYSCKIWWSHHVKKFTFERLFAQCGPVIYRSIR